VFGRFRGCGGNSSSTSIRVQGGIGKGVQYNQLRDNRDAFRANNGGVDMEVDVDKD
jgi:hypothetical protein